MNRHQRRLAKKQTGAPQGHSLDRLNQLVALATQHLDAERFEHAEEAYRQILAIRPDYAGACHNLGYALDKQNKLDEAAAYFKKALALKPDFAEALNCLGNVCMKQHNTYEAESCFMQALSIKPDYAKAHNSLGCLFEKQQKLPEAAACYKQALTLKPDYAEAYYNIGNVFYRQSNLNEAETYLKRALALKPNFVEAINCLGNVLMKQQKIREAEMCFSQALAIKPDYAEAHYNRGVTLQKMNRHGEAMANLDKALTLKPDIPYLLGAFLHTKMFLCDWQGIDGIFKRVSEQISAGKPAAVPFTLLPTPLSPAQQRTCAEIFVRHTFPPSADSLWNGEQYAHDRIRLGYFSSDFRNHATAYLMAELFERHDRSRFEITGFSFGPANNDEMHRRLAKSFEHFIDVSDKSDLEIAMLARSMEIDIAVDLKGFTQDNRTGIFALRPAPVQVNYLGYPGTMGAYYIDYLIADATIISEERKRYYNEKIVTLPDSYQANDASKKISESMFTRRELGLPEGAFVFCAFNSHYKITPDIFDIWMRLLHKVEGSVLWLLEGNPTATQNLCAEAASRGIAEHRLVFAKRIELAEHLARHRHADLFLDTFYCNAHTTASDALWTGLPLLTCAGETFAGRVAASLLHAVGLPELVTHSHAEYEELALALAADPQKLSAIREKLARNRDTCLLFDTERFTRHIEAAYIKMWERSQADQSPDHMDV